jgi:hypothetical protein
VSVISDDTVQVPIDLVGGLYTLSDSQCNPPGASPNVQDAQFLPGLPGTVGTRPGLLTKVTFTNLIAPQAVNYARTFRDLQQRIHNLYFDASQKIWEEIPENTYTNIASVYQSKYVKSDTAFGREWLGFSDGKFGTDAPRQWDGVNLDRVSQDGPGTAPLAVGVAGLNGTITASANGLVLAVASHGQYTTSSITSVGQAAGTVLAVLTVGLSAGNRVGDVFGVLAGSIFAGIYTIAAIVSPTNIIFYSSITGTDNTGSNVVTALVEVVPTAPMANIPINTMATIQGATQATYNGVWQVREQTDSTHFYVYIPSQISNGATSSGGGTITTSGNLSSGLHQVVVFYLTRHGYFTRPSPPSSFATVAGQEVTVSNIPTGPSNVIARYLAFTAAGGGNFYYIPTNFIIAPGLVPPTPTIINDNTTTSATFDFSDTALLSSISTNVDDLFDVLTLGEVAGFMQYANRMFAWGERNKLQNLLNLSFDGGSIGGIPTGWIPTGTVAGALDAANTTVPGLAGYRITGDGATAKVGALQQKAASDYLGVGIILPNTAYSVRFRLLKNVTLAAGTFHINLSSVIGGGLQGTDAAVVFNDANLSGVFHEYILPLTVTGTFPTTVFSDLLLNVYADGTPTLNGYFTVDDIEIFPTLQPYNLGLVRASDAADPETYKGTTGFLNVNANDDQRVTCLYPIRDTLRIAKEHGLFSSVADPASEPDGWNVTLVSSVVGSVTLNSAGPKNGEMGKEWAALLCREGVFLDYGNTNPEKLNQEVQRSNGVSAFSFDGVNWAQAHTAWITVDMQRRRMLVGLPMGAATSPSVIAAMDFRAPKLGDPAILSQMPLVAMSTFTNKQVALSGGRKWCPWTITANSGGMIERADGTAHLFLGNGAANGKLYDLLDSQTTDDGVTIPFFFQASYLPDDDRKNIAYKFQGGLVLAKYLRIFAQGSGNLKMTLIGTGGVKQLILPLATAPVIALANPASQDIESMCDFRSERISVLVQATGQGSWLSMQKLELFLCQSPTDALRGSN